MPINATAAIRAWVNANRALTGKGKPLPNGSFLDGQGIRSPAGGAYALLSRDMGTIGDLVAEPGGPVRARITAHVFAGSVETAESAAAALAAAWHGLSGRPEPAGKTGVLILTAADVADPGYVEVPGAGGEVFEFTVSAEFVLCQP